MYLYICIITNIYCRYKTEKKTMLEKINEEKIRIEKNNNIVDAQGKLLMNIRAALQNIASMIMCIKPSKSFPKVKDGVKGSKEVEEIEPKEPEINECEVPVENEGMYQK
jgi:hypothetical protein